MFARVDLHVGGLLTWRSGLVDGDVLEGSGRDIAVSSPGADKGLVLVVDVDFFHGSVGVAQARAVETDADTKRGAICWFGVGGK